MAVINPTCDNSVRAGSPVSSGVAVAVIDSIAVTGGAEVGVDRMLVGVGGGAEGSGVMIVLADLEHAVAATNNNTTPI